MPPTIDTTFEWPDLRAEKVLAVDCETDGLGWKSRAVGFAVCTESRDAWYFPWGHKQGANLDREKVIAWAKDNLANKIIVNHTTKEDIKWLLKEGIDLEALGCSFEDWQFEGALLDERALRYDLDTMGRKYVGRGKIVLPSKQPIHTLSSSIVGLYACEDVRLVIEGRKFTRPLIDREDLTRVLQLENDLIPAVVSMEVAGAPLDQEKLYRWSIEIPNRIGKLMLELWRLTNRRYEPNSTQEMLKLFNYLRVDPPVGCKRKGCTFSTLAPGPDLCPRCGEVTGPTFEGALLETFEHPAIKLAIEIRRLESLDSKFISKYRNLTAEDGILRYNLNQLKVDKGPDGGKYGTVTGRFSSSDVNIQQVPKPSKQKLETRDFIVRELFIPGEDALFISADASQIEYRIFAHYAGDEALIEAYKTDPTTNIHRWVESELRNAYGADITYDLAKNINFMCVYGGGANKLAEMSGLPVSVVQPMFDGYHARFPSVRKVTSDAENTAKRKGYVRTLLGRRRRYDRSDKKERFYTAFNAACQGTAADIMKLKLIQLYKEQRAGLPIKLRMTVHDEVVMDGSKKDPRILEKICHILDEPAIPMRVPIPWKAKSGANWMEAG